MKHIKGLDDLRAFAIIGVVLYHLIPQLLPGGFIGVNLFFVLSGFLLAYTTLRDMQNRTFSIKLFYLKRVLRIYPALILLVLTACFFARIFTPAAMYGIRKEVLSIFLGYNNWWQISRNASYFARISNVSLFTHLWCIAVELQYYLIWPVLFFTSFYVEMKTNWKAEYCFLVLVAVSFIESLFLYRPGQDPTRIYYGTDTRSYALLFGSALGIYEGKKLRRNAQQVGKAESEQTRLYKEILLAACLPVLVIFYLTVYGQSALTYRLWMPVSVVLSAGLVYLCAEQRLHVIHIPEVKFLQKIGKYSYEVYLVMFPIIYIVLHILKTASHLPVILLSIALIILAAIWLHQVCVLLLQKDLCTAFRRRLLHA